MRIMATPDLHGNLRGLTPRARADERLAVLLDVPAKHKGFMAARRGFLRCKGDRLRKSAESGRLVA